MSKVAVVDGANVAFDEKTENGKAKVQNMLKMRHLLEKKGYKPIIIVDASLRYEIDDQKQYEKLISDNVILQAPTGTPADFFVLKTAELQNGVVVSNDRYEDYAEEFPNVRDRRVPFMVVDGDVILYDLEEKDKH